MKLHYIPNILTCLRFLLVGPVILMLLNHHYLFALGLFILAGITDALDGLLARLYGWTTRFGAIADPLADKLLLMSSFVTLCWLHLIPVWLMIVIVTRDIWLMLGVLSYRYITGRIEVEPSGISKINTFLQILLVPLVLVDLSILPLPSLLLNAFMFTVLLTSVASFLHYTWIWGKRAWQTKTVYSSHKKIGAQKEAA